MKEEIKIRILERNKWKCARCDAPLYLIGNQKKVGEVKAHFHHIVDQIEGVIMNLIFLLLAGLVKSNIMDRILTKGEVNV